MVGRINQLMQHLTTPTVVAAEEPAMRGFPYMMKQREQRTSSGLTLGASKPLEWYCLNDVVMGGQSVSACEADGAGGLTFSGTISTVGGGFASCRTHDESSLASADGGTPTAVRLHYTCDESNYKVTFSCTGSMTSGESARNRDLNFQHQLPEQGAGTHTVDVPLAQLNAVRTQASLQVTVDFWSFL